MDSSVIWTPKKKTLLWVEDEKDLAEFLPLRAPDYPKILEERSTKAIRSLTDRGFRQNEYNLCRQSCSYWIKYYGWIYNPLYIGQEIMPWIPFEVQEEFLDFGQQLLIECNQPPPKVRREVVAMPKCREMGVSWIVTSLQAWDWNYHAGSHLILSRKEEEVDQTGNLDTPFEKIRFLLRHIPEWQLPEGFNWRKNSNVMSLKHPDNTGHIGGDSMSGEAGAGGRVRSILFDESAKVKDGKDFKAFTSCSFTSNLKFSVSTPEGPKNKLAHLVSNEDGDNAIVIWMKWWKDPRKMHNYRWQNGRITSDWNEEAKRSLDADSYASQVSCSFQKSTKGAIYGEQYKRIHQVKGLEPEYGVKVTRQHDPGPHWFTTWTQMLPCGCYLVLDEEYFEGKGIEHIASTIQSKTFDNYDDFEIVDVGDPAGSHKKSVITRSGQGDVLKSEYQALQDLTGIIVQYGFMYKIPREEWITRGIQSVRGRLTNFCVEHERPYLQIDPAKCPILHGALSGNYAYKVGADGKPTDIVDEYHPVEDAADSLKYGPLSKGWYLQPRVSKSKLKRAGQEWITPSGGY